MLLDSKALSNHLTKPDLVKVLFQEWWIVPICYPYFNWLLISSICFSGKEKEFYSFYGQCFENKENKYGMFFCLLESLFWTWSNCLAILFLGIHTKSAHSSKLPRLKAIVLLAWGTLFSLALFFLYHKLRTNNGCNIFT